MKTFKQFQEEWSNKYKKSINCSAPKGFSRAVLIVPQEEKGQKVKKLSQNQLNE